MRDETYAFIEDVKQRGQMAFGYRHKKIGVKSRRCSLPSDNLTAAQKRRMNGVMSSYKMNEPHTWKEIKWWPIDLQKEYLQHLRDITISGAEIAQVLDVSRSYVTQLSQAMCLPKMSSAHRTRTPEEERAWREFLGEEVLDPEPEPEPEVQVEEVPQPEPVVQAEKVQDPVTTVCQSIEVTFTGTLSDAMRALSLLPIGKGQRRITVRVE